MGTEPRQFEPEGLTSPSSVGPWDSRLCAVPGNLTAQGRAGQGQQRLGSPAEENTAEGLWTGMSNSVDITTAGVSCSPSVWVSLYEMQNPLFVCWAANTRNAFLFVCQ